MFASRWRRRSAGGPQRVEIIAENLQRDLRAHARQHVVEPMRDRLADVDGDRQHREPRPQIVDDLGLAPAVRLQINFDIGRMDAFGVLIQFGAAGSPPDALHLRHFKDEAFGDEAHPVETRTAKCPD